MLDFVSLGWTTQKTKSEESFISIHTIIGFNLLVMAGSVASMPVIKQSIMVMKACDRGFLSHGRLKEQANQNETGGYTTPQNTVPWFLQPGLFFDFSLFPNNAITVCIHWRISLLSKSGALACNHIPPKPISSSQRSQHINLWGHFILKITRSFISLQNSQNPRFISIPLSSYHRKALTLV